MKKLLFIVFLAASVYAASDIPIIIDDLSLGLDTRNTGYTGEYGFGKLVHNFNLRENPGDLTVRLGYDSAFAMYGLDSFLWNGIHTISYLDGSKNLALVGDSSGVGYANVYVTDQNTTQLGISDSIWLYPDTTTYFGSYAVPASAYSMIFYIKKNNTQYKKVEAHRSTAFTRAEVVDSLVAIINAESELNARITASDLGDTLLIVEDSSDLDVDFIFYTTDSSCLSTPAGDYSSMRVVKTQSFQTSTGNRIRTRFPATGQLWWNQFKGVTYLGTGTGKAISYDGRTTNTFPMRAPGEPNIITLTTSGTLNGRYRYAFKYAYVDSVADTLQRPTFSYLSQPVIADSQQVMLWDFPLPTRDYYYQGADTLSIEVWRSTGDIGTLDQGDTIWNTGIVITFADSGGYADTVVIDTMSDTTLRAQSYQIYADGNFYSWQSGSIDTLIHRIHSKPGAPSIVSWGSANGTLGIWGGADDLTDTVRWTEAAGYSYMCVYIDTNLNSPSDSGRSFNLYQGIELRNYTTGGFETNTTYDDSTTVSGVTLGFSRKNTEKLTLALPIQENTNQVLLYRGIILPMQFDTTFTSSLRDPRSQAFINFYSISVSSDSFAVPYYYLIGAFTPGDTVVDSLCYDSLLLRDQYDRNDIPPIIKQMVSYKNQLISTDGQYVYDSDPSLDSVSFNIFNKNPINIDDGDEITTLIPQFGVIRVLKNKSSYILKQNSAGYWRDLEASKNYGSVTGLSWIPAPEGDYFLSKDGVRLENENIYRENSTIGSLMSNRLSNFTNMTAAVQKQCFGTYIDGLAVFSFPNLDTSYVLNKIPLDNGQYRYSWSTWDKIVMCGATKYDVRTDNVVYPGDTTYFIKSGSNGVYRYGTSYKDVDADVQYYWRSTPLTDLLGYKQLNNFYVEVKSGDTTDQAHVVNFYPAKGGASEYQILLPRLDTSLIYLYSMGAAQQHKSWEVLLAKNPITTSYSSLVYRKLYVDFKYRGRLPTR